MKPRFYFQNSRRHLAFRISVGAPLVLGFAISISGLGISHADPFLGGGGGSSSPAAPAASPTTGVTTPSDTSQARANAQDTLIRTTNAIAAVRAMQDAARAAAVSGPDHLAPGLPTVTNGLGSGGLQVAPGVGTDPTQWQGAELPTQTKNLQGLVNVGVRQTAQQALLQWQTFNVGKETTITFDQSAAGANANQWIAFNRVTDPTGNPSQILGQIKAQGQVYVINPNGVIFGGSSQVDVNTLTVTSLPINTNLIERGLLNNPDAQFLFSGLSLPAGINGTPSFTPDAPPASTGIYGDVTIQSGAKITTPVSADGNGGRVLLVGPNVSNAGSILTPNGQTILAAGLQVGVAAHATADPSLRGLDVFVGAVEDGASGAYAGSVTQNGLVEAQRGNITLAGKSIIQNGALVSTTSVSLNGRVDLIANFNAVSNRASANSTGDPFLYKKSGAITLGEDSVIRILPEYTSNDTTIGTVLALRSQVNLTGKTIHLEPNSEIYAPNALANLNAGTWVFEDGTIPRSTFLKTGGQVYAGAGSIIDVSGSSNVSAPASQNIISVDLRGAELANSPLQRLGNLRNLTVLVDIRNTGIYQGNAWIGTPLADISGFANLIQRNVGQLTVAGGTVNITAGSSVVVREGAMINVSPGSIIYAAGPVRTTTLITEAGRLVDISAATPDVVYQGIYDGTFMDANPKFGIQKTYTAGIIPGAMRMAPSSTEIAAGGKLSISAPSMAIDGVLLGRTATIDRQLLAPPAASSLSLTFQAQDITYPDFPIHSPNPPAITFDASENQISPDSFAVDANGDPLELRQDRRERVVLSPDLLSDNGFGILNIDNRDGSILVPENTNVETAAGGSITFKASNITINGAVSARSGSLSFATHGISLDEINVIRNTVPGANPPTVRDGRGIFMLGANGVLDASGLLVDDRLNPSAPTSPRTVLKGGVISIEGYSADLVEGGRADVSGGASVSAKGSYSFGNAGSISVTAGREIGFSSTLGGSLTLDSTLTGLSGAKAGSLAILAPSIQIGGDISDDRITLIEEDFLNAGDFGNFTLTAIGLTADGSIPALKIASGADIRPVVDGLLGQIDGDNRLSLTRITKEEGVRTPASLAFRALGAIYNGDILSRGDILMEAGAMIETDSKGSVSFRAQTVTLGGTVIVPGGGITVEGASSFPLAGGALPTQALPTVHLTETALLSTRGKVVLTANPLNLRQGEVVAGGLIGISGDVIAEAGAILDVSGVNGVLDLPASSSSLNSSQSQSLTGALYVPASISSNAGSITLAGSNMLFSDATLVANAGGLSAKGGSLSVSSGRFLRNGQSYTSADENLIVTAGGMSLSDQNVAPGIGVPVLDETGGNAVAQGYFTADNLVGSGIDSLTLGGNVRFAGDVSLELPGSLRVATGGVIYADGDVRMEAGHVALGQAFRTPSQQSPTLFEKGLFGGNSFPPHQFAPVHGNGSLTVTAKLIDVGVLSLQGIGSANLLAANGDVRGNGTFQIAGDLLIEAGQIYPTTQRAFGIFAYDHASASGSVTIRGGELRSLPFSAGGSLSIHASDISQNGTLRAPLGTITLGWDGTGSAPLNPIAGSSVAAPVTKSLTLGSSGVTSSSLIDPITLKPVTLPYGISFDGSSWIDPAGNDITVGGVPRKRIQLAGENVITEENSVIDIQGGGDLYAYRWISGNGGTRDILASDTSFAIIPGFGFDYAPYAPFNSDSSATNLAGQPGYANNFLKPGDQITLAGGAGLPGGTYTLLPARYALLPNAFLVTPQSGTATNSVQSPDGSSFVSGYVSNNLNPDRVGATLITRFEIAGSPVVRARAEYQDLLATKVLKQAAINGGFSVPRLPLDAGYLSFSSTSGMSLNGSVRAGVLVGGRGGLIDINSSSAILINESGAGGTGGQLVLKADQLNRFGAESLLIGGLREEQSGGTSVIANTTDLELDNAGAALTGADIILVSGGRINIAQNSKITSTANDDLPSDTLLLDGNGVLVRVTADASGSVSRSGVTSPNPAELVIGSGAALTGGGIVLDSTSAIGLSPLAVLSSESVSLSSGLISIQLSQSGTLPANSGLVLSESVLDTLQDSAKKLTLLSYSTIDTYGHGSVGTGGLDNLSLLSSAIRGFNVGTGAVRFAASKLTLGNPGNIAAAPPLPPAVAGNLAFDAAEITLGGNAMLFEGFADTTLTALSRVLLGSGSLHAAGDLRITSGLLTAQSAAKFSLSSSGLLNLDKPAVILGDPRSGGLGADVTLQGAQVKVDGDVTLPSGSLTLRALTGDLVLGASRSSLISLGGTATTFADSIRYTNGGSVSLVADQGSIRSENDSTISVAAHPGGGNAGSIRFKAPQGGFVLEGSILGAAGANGLGGSVILDTGSLSGGSLASLDAILNEGGFNRTRSYRVRTGDIEVDGIARSDDYRISADGGSISVSGTIDASGEIGGSISLQASGSLIVRDGAVLDASALKFNSAGKGGSVVLQAGNSHNGTIDASAWLDLRAGSFIDLSVLEKSAASESQGKFSGTLHLRAPRVDGNNDLRVESIGGSITGASHILVEGAKLYTLSGTGSLTTTIQTAIKDDATAFLGAAGTTTAGYTAMISRLTSLQPSLDLTLAPGAEIINPGGDLTLGTTTSNATIDWNLQTYRFGAKSAAGVLTLRAAGDIVFYNALSDGFAAVTPAAANGNSSLWLAPLMARNANLPANLQSWSYHFSSGADLSSADFRSVLSPGGLAQGKGSFLLGKNAGNAATTGSGANHTTARAIANNYQVVRTGSGNISIHAGRDIHLLNQFATIYSAGTVVSDPTRVVTAGDFSLPIFLSAAGRHPGQGVLGAIQQPYFVQYSMAGGNVTLEAGNDIAHKTRNVSSATGGSLIDDSSRQLPNHWLYRRGYIDPATGRSGVAGTDDGSIKLVDVDASLTWWVDYSNFFQGVGTLGGGNVTLSAGNDVMNVDAVSPTNARMAGGIPSLAGLSELGGGDILVTAGRNISGGVYYVERGDGVLKAGNEILTNATRSPSRGIIQSLTNPAVLGSATWLPTTFFIGKGGFSLESAGDLLMGISVNTFLLPQGLNNKFWYKTYFSSYSQDSYLRASSLGGDVTMRAAASLPSSTSAQPILSLWTVSQYQLSANNSPSSFQPWLRLAESETEPFSGNSGISAPNLSLEAPGGDIRLVGDVTTFPAVRGQLELYARDSILGLQPTGLIQGRDLNYWASSTITVSDADPANLPSITNPYAYLGVVGRAASAQRQTGALDAAGFLDIINATFTETGSTNGVLQDQQRLHTAGGLHAGDNNPLRIYADTGNIEGITLFSPKSARVIAGNDIGDIALYLQNLAASDISLVSAGRDIIPYSEGTITRLESLASRNAGAEFVADPLAGDIQIAGPGELQILAGRNLDLGLGSSNQDGTGTGITSIGNGRNPFLGSEGANITLGAGIGASLGLGSSNLSMDDFIRDFVLTEKGREYLDVLAPDTDFESLPDYEQERLALEIFYLTLRDTGRDFNDPDSEGYRKYDNGKKAIETLFPESFEWAGEILTQSRDIRTRSGGNIQIFAPGGGVEMASTTIGNPLTPPGIVTESGGNISIFTRDDVSIGIGRIFTLKGGDIVIWASEGDIAAGSSSRTVSAAPPTRVIISPQSGAVATDLAGLATGGGIGVLATVKGVEPGDVDLIAPTGIIDAGDAGIRVSGNINLAAVTVVNAGNISAGGTSTGAPSASVSAPAISTPAPTDTSASNTDTVVDQQKQAQQANAELSEDDTLSVYTVEVIGYGGGAADEEDEDDEEKRRRKREAELQ
jgi:filamentous hemagglutinin family protein